MTSAQPPVQYKRNICNSKPQTLLEPWSTQRQHQRCAATKHSRRVVTGTDISYVEPSHQAKDSAAGAAVWGAKMSKMLSYSTPSIPKLVSQS